MCILLSASMSSLCRHMFMLLVWYILCLERCMWPCSYTQITITTRCLEEWKLYAFLISVPNGGEWTASLPILHFPQNSRIHRRVHRSPSLALFRVISIYSTFCHLKHSTPVVTIHDTVVVIRWWGLGLSPSPRLRITLFRMPAAACSLLFQHPYMHTFTWENAPCLGDKEQTSI